MSLPLGECIASHYAAPRERVLDNPTDLGLSVLNAPVAEAQWSNVYQDPQLTVCHAAHRPTTRRWRKLSPGYAQAHAKAAKVGAGQGPSISYDAVETRKRFQW
jgi:hypothetical protein